MATGIPHLQNSHLSSRKNYSPFVHMDIHLLLERSRDRYNTVERPV